MKKQILNFDNNNILQPAYLRRADGETATHNPDPQETASALLLGQLIGRRTLSRRPGIHIGDWFLSAELLVLTATLAVSIIALRRRTY